MILITVTGDTYPMRSRFAGMRYRWNGATRSWSKLVAEASLDKECNEIRPLKSFSDTPEPRIILELRRVDINGNPLSPSVMKVHLRSMARPGENILKLFNEEVSVNHIPPVYDSPDPIEPKKRTVDEGFY